MRGYEVMKKITMVITAAVLLALLVYQGSIAFFHAQTSIDTKLSAGTLGIKLVEEDISEMNDEHQMIPIMPGSIINHKVYIKNIKEKTLYVRVIATKYWEDQNGHKITNADASKIKLMTKNPENWIINDDSQNSNSEVIYYYYRKPIKANEITPNLIDMIKIDENLSNKEYSHYKMRVDLEANAVQSTAAVEAVLSEWGADLKLDDQGMIISIAE